MAIQNEDKINIKFLYTGNSFRSPLKEAGIESSAQTDVCIKAAGDENPAEIFTPCEIENTHIMIVNADENDEKAIRNLLKFAQHFKSLNKDGLMLGVTSGTLSNNTFIRTLGQNLDHFILIDNESIYSPLKMLNAIFQEGFMPVEFCDVCLVFKGHKASIFSSFDFESGENIAERLDSYISETKSYCNVGRCIDGLIVNLSIDGCKTNLEFAEDVFSKFKNALCSKDSELAFFGQFASNKSFLKGAVLAMMKNA